MEVSPKAGQVRSGDDHSRVVGAQLSWFSWDYGSFLIHCPSDTQHQRHFPMQEMHHPVAAGDREVNATSYFATCGGVADRRDCDGFHPKKRLSFTRFQVLCTHVVWKTSGKPAPPQQGQSSMHHWHDVERSPKAPQGFGC